MNKKLNIEPSEHELPSSYADRLGLLYASTSTINHKKKKGQYFTPVPIANLMASFCEVRIPEIKILDAGCGTCVLTCSLIEYLLSNNEQLNMIHVVAYETDEDLFNYAEESIKYLNNWLQSKNITFRYNIHFKDFIIENAHALTPNDQISSDPNNLNPELFDVIISNPPYFKLSIDDEHTKVSKLLISGQPNIYAIFMGIAAKLLKEKGELIFITPRSFASGNYFKAFREFFFNNTKIDRIHLFCSRRDTFDRDKVLQETVIVKATKGRLQDLKNIVISSSYGLGDILQPVIKNFPVGHVIDLKSKEKIIHLPTDDKEVYILELVSKWVNRLLDYHIQISTGPVVAFRALDYLQNSDDLDPDEELAPLFWLHNVNKMSLQYPSEFKNKAQYIKIVKGSMPLLLPNKNYILLRRFSTKDDKSRLIAAPYFCNLINSNYIGVENKVNYIYKLKGHLERSELVGLCSLLNCELFDRYFQIFNGNVNVSATELREMKFPSIEVINEIGNIIILSNDFSMKNVNKTIAKYFKLTSIFDYE